MPGISGVRALGFVCPQCGGHHAYVLSSGDPRYLKMRVTKGLRQTSVKSFAKYNSQAGMLRWLHIPVSNAKAYIPGTYHGLPGENQQSYLDEFCCRFNRRRFGEGAFARLAAAVVG